MMMMMRMNALTKPRSSRRMAQWHYVRGTGTDSPSNTALIVGGYLVLLAGGGGCWTTTGQAPNNRTFCDAAAAIAAATPMVTTTTTTTTPPEHEQLLQTTPPPQPRSWRRQWHRAWKMMWRCAKLAVTLAPIVLLYPIYWWNQRYLLPMDPTMDAQDKLLLWRSAASSSSSSRPPQQGPGHAAAQAHYHHDHAAASAWVEWYFSVALQCVQASGAAVIKLMQWAGSRPDLFGYEFCAIFAQLQDHTKPHDWRYTETVLEQALGSHWQERILDIYPQPLGSGCIGQVYRGTILVAEDDEDDDPSWTTMRSSSKGQNATNKKKNASKEPKTQDVAIKVLHPNVQEDIETDLDLMRFWVRVLDRVLPYVVATAGGGGDNSSSNWSWMDWPEAVEEFGKLLTRQLDLRTEAAHLQRFHGNFAHVPHIIFPQLVPGFPPTRNLLVETYHEGTPVLQFAQEHPDDRRRLSDLCFKAMECVCQMIFLDNFLHGDLHPGNVLVSKDGTKLILLDVGIVAEYSDEDHQVIVDVLSNFIRRNGRKAGQCMIADSNRRRRSPEQQAVDEALFLDKMQALAWNAADPKKHLMEHLGSYISQVCEAASVHHIMLNPAFVSAALALKVQEAVGLSLDPQLEMWKVATPIIAESERRRRRRRLLGL
ncbi:hypothetical protein ACA910_018871 [Epithemia clementina (nom. ined.)]